MPLSDVEIRNTKAGPKLRKIYDANGLFLAVHPNGSKYWRLRYRYAGKERSYQIGVYPEISLKDAREAATKAKRLVKEGLDPVAQRRVERAANVARQLDSFAVVLRDWMTRNRTRWGESYVEKIQSVLNANILPRIGGIAITQLTTPMVINAVNPMIERGAIEQAYRAFRWISAVFRFAIITGRATHNPLAGVRPSEALPPRRARSHPHLRQNELGTFLRKLHDYPGRPETRLAVKLLLLTFVRTRELRAARWEEFDFRSKQWRIPAERMKMREEHIVPLAVQTIASLEELRGLTGYSEYLFPNHNKHPYMSENTINRAIGILGYKGKVVGHGFRATASTILNESGQFSADCIERQLAHRDSSLVRAIYNRAQHLPERREMMQWWANFLDGVVRETSST